MRRAAGLFAVHLPSRRDQRKKSSHHARTIRPKTEKNQPLLEKSDRYNLRADFETFPRTDMDQALECVTALNFCGQAYLAANPDVAEAVRLGALRSGRSHFEVFGISESHRRQDAQVATRSRQERRKRIESVHRTDMPFSDDGKFFDFLSPDLRSQFDIYDSELAGSNMYDSDALGMIERHPSGIILDCGAGSRPAIYENVVNFDITNYPSTDVRGVGEVLPFKDASFDGVLSLNVWNT